MTNTLNSTFIDESRTNSANSGYSMKLRGLQIDTSAEGDGIDSRLIVGTRNNPVFEANTSGVYFANVDVGTVYANGSLGTNGQVLASNGSGTYWKTIVSGGPGGNTSSYLQVANAVATYTPKINPATSGLLAHTGRATISTNLNVSGNTTIGGLIANGSLGSGNQVLKTNGTTVFWATVAGGGSDNTKATWTALLSTNTALRILISDRLQVTNATTLLATKASWAALTSTNTALRLLISDRLQVANAATIYQTKAVERAALANTNAFIKSQLANTNSSIASRATWVALTGTNTALRTLISDRIQVANVNTLLAAKATWSGLTSTNTALRTLISDRLQVANAATLYATKSNPTTSGLLAHTGRATISTNLSVSGNTTLGAAAKSITSTGIFSHTGQASISSHLTITGNTTMNNRLNGPNRIWLSRDAYLQSWIGCAGTNAEANNNAGAFLVVTSDASTGVPSAVNIRVGGSNRIAITTTTSTLLGVLALTGRQTISTNLAVTGNTSSNKITVTNRLLSPGNTVVGTGNATRTIVNGLLTANGRIDALQNLTVAGNTTLGAAAKTITSTGLISHTGRATISTNLAVTGNTSSNKITVTASMDGSTANTQVKALGVGTTPGTNGSIRATENITAYYSDERLKTVLGLIDDPLGKVNTLRGFYFEPNEEAQRLGYKLKREVGVSAQEVQRILPEIIAPAPISDLYMTVHYEKLIPLLIEAIKVLDKNVIELRQEIEVLKSSKL